MQMTHTSEIPGVEALNQTIHSKIGMDRSAWLHLQRFKNLLDTSEHIVLPSTIELFSLHFQLHKPVFQTVEISNNAPIVFAFQCSGTGHAHLAISGKKKETITSSQGNSFISFFAPTACYNMEIPVQQDYQNLHILISPNKLNHLLNEQFDEVPKLLHPVIEGNGHSSLYLKNAISESTAHLIKQLDNCPYKGQLRILHLENISLELIIRRIHEAYLQQERIVPKLSQLRGIDKERLHAARDLLLADLEYPPTLYELSQLTEISISKLKRGFRILFGTTYTELLRHERLKRAQELLFENRFSITEIGYQLGYSDTSHFIREFSKRYGVTPGRFI